MRMNLSVVFVPKGKPGRADGRDRGSILFRLCGRGPKCEKATDKEDGETLKSNKGVDEYQIAGGARDTCSNVLQSRLTKTRPVLRATEKVPLFLEGKTRKKYRALEATSNNGSR